MAVTVDWQAKVVESTASITDIVAFKDALRDLEDDAIGMLYPPIITYKRLGLGGGAFFHAVDFINGYILRFPVPGNYEIVGNIGAVIDPLPGVFVDRLKSSAFATVVGEGGAAGPTVVEIADEIMARLNATTIPTNVKRVNDVLITGAGVPGNSMRPA
jgi:hypothetical protein